MPSNDTVTSTDVTIGY